MSPDGPGNGERYLPRSWAEEHLRQHAEEWRDHRRHDVEPMLTQGKLDMERESAQRAALAARIDAIEALLDQLRGAKALIYLLIGSNLLAALAVVLGIVR